MSTKNLAWMIGAAVVVYVVIRVNRGTAAPLPGEHADYAIWAGTGAASGGGVWI